MPALIRKMAPHNLLTSTSGDYSGAWCSH